MNLYNLSIVAIMLCTSFFTIFYTTDIWKRTSLGQKIVKKKRRAPVKDKLLRSPGETLRNQEYDMTVELVGNMMIFLSSSMVLALAFLSISERNTFPIFHLSILIIYLFLFLFYTRKLRIITQDRELFRLGLDGELATAQEINQLMYYKYFIYHDFPAENFNIDHIIIGPTGVFAVETKNRSKPVGEGKKTYSVSVNGDTLTFPNSKDTMSIPQAKDQAEWLSDFLEESVGKPIEVSPVLALPGWMVNRDAHDKSLMVINPKECIKTITDRGTVLDDQTIKQIKYQIEKRCRTVDLYEPI